MMTLHLHRHHQAKESSTRVRTFFDRLGDRIDDAWKRSFYEDRDLPAIAERELLADPPHLSVSLKDVVRWALTARSLGLQPNERFAFGQPPITVYSGRRFYIEVLTWLDSTTAIHDHGFVGAFSVLEGSSVHSTYRFNAEKRLSTRIVVGDVVFETAEILRQGDVRPIPSGAAFIHALYHMEHPSVSIVVRTAHAPDAGSQYVYLPPYLGFNPNDNHVWNNRAKNYVDAAISIGSLPLIEETIRLAIENADDVGALSIIRSMFVRNASRTGLIGGDGSVEETESEEDKIMSTAYDMACDAFRARFGAATDQVFRACEEDIRSQELAAARSNVRDVNHRFFLALLMNVPNRQRLLELVGESYPSEEPIQLVCKWVRELTDDSGPLLHYAIGTDALVVLESLIRGTTSDEAINQLASRHGRALTGNEQTAIVDAFSTLRKFPLVRPLLKDSDQALRI
jgi:hypothetical protein